MGLWLPNEDDVLSWTNLSAILRTLARSSVTAGICFRAPGKSAFARRHRVLPSVPLNHAHRNHTAGPVGEGSGSCNSKARVDRVHGHTWIPRYRNSVIIPVAMW